MVPVSVAYKNGCAWPRDERAGRGRTFESCRAHGSTKPFSKARNAEKCAIRTSYSASVRTREADEPCPEGAGSEGPLGFVDSGAGSVGASEDGVLQDGADKAATVTDQRDPHGYLRLKRSLDFIKGECLAAGETELGEQVARAARFAAAGSPSEFLGEASQALRSLVEKPGLISRSVVAFAESLDGEIREGFDRVGGG
jgi:hypothetical protein